MIMMSQFWDLRVFQVQKYFFPLCDVKVFIYLEHVGHYKTLTTIKFVFVGSTTDHYANCCLYITVKI